MTLKFEHLPQAVSKILEKLEHLQLAVENGSKPTEPDKWFTLDELVEYDPEKRAKQTFYGLVSKGAIPFHKRGKKLTFLKSEIDLWLKSASRVSIADFENTKRR